MKNNIYTRIGEVLSSTGIIDSVLAYDANEEEVLIKAGFVRCGSTTVNGDIVDVYKKTIRKIIKIDLDNMSSSEQYKFIEQMKYEMKHRVIKDNSTPLYIGDYYTTTDTTYDGHQKVYSDKPYLTQWNYKF